MCPGSDYDDDVSISSVSFIHSQSEMRLRLAKLLEEHASGTGMSASRSSEGTLVMLGLVQLLDAIIISGVDTTPEDANNHMMQLVAAQYGSVLALFRS